MICNYESHRQMDGTPKQMCAPWFRCPFGILNLVLVLSTTRASMTLINTFHVLSPSFDTAELFIHQPYIHTWAVTISEPIPPKFTGNQNATQLCLCMLPTGFFLQESRYVENKAVNSGSSIFNLPPSLGKSCYKVKWKQQCLSKTHTHKQKNNSCR